MNMPRPLTPEALHRHMEGVRGKKIVVLPASTGMAENGVCGLWLEIAGESFERVHHAPTDSAVHRQQLINHEYGHMILHHRKELLPADRVALLAPLIPMDSIAYALARSSFTDEQEALAEAIGDELAMLMRADSTSARTRATTGFGRVL